MNRRKTSTDQTLFLNGLLVTSALLCLMASPWSQGIAGGDEKPSEVSLEDRIDRLIQQLGHDRGVLRDRAQAELSDIGPPALDALTQALGSEDIEVVHRAHYLLGVIQVDWSSESDSKHLSKLMEIYRSDDRQQRLSKVDKLAHSSGEAEMKALCRILRYDHQRAVSMRAALALIHYHYPSDEAWQQRSAQIEKLLHGSTRPGAQWVIAFLQSRRDPEKTLGEWRRLIEAEKTTLRTQPDKTNLHLVAQFLYSIAELEHKTGQEELAKKTAAEARAAAGEDGSLHVTLATALVRRGLFDWAEQEFRQAIEIGPITAKHSIHSNYSLALMLHDQGHEQKAGDALKPLVEAIEAKPHVKKKVREARRHPEAIIARMKYYYARQAAIDKDEPLQENLLQEAISVYPIDPDVLIALYRLHRKDSTKLRQTKSKINVAIARFRQISRSRPNSATYHNQLAWLLGNTLGETNESLGNQAILASERSLELIEGTFLETHSYLDTLARCHYARGHYQEALEIQTKAVTLNPHSGQMKKLLKLIQEAINKESEGDKESTENEVTNKPDKKM